MKQYHFSFDFDGGQYIADATEIDGLDKVQFAISTRNEALAARFRTNIIVKEKESDEWHFDFPAGSDGDLYMQALLEGLRRHLLTTT